MTKKVLSKGICRQKNEGGERGREGINHFVINLSDQSPCDQIFDEKNYAVGIMNPDSYREE